MHAISRTFCRISKRCNSRRFSSNASSGTADGSRSDAFYVSVGLGTLFGVGGPSLLVYELQNDPETRDYFEEHFPQIVSAVGQIVDLEKAQFRQKMQAVERFDDGTKL